MLKLKRRRAERQAGKRPPTSFLKDARGKEVEDDVNAFREKIKSEGLLLEPPKYDEDVTRAPTSPTNHTTTAAEAKEEEEEEHDEEEGVEENNVVDPDVERSLLGMRYAALFGETKDFDNMLRVTTTEASSLCGVDILQVREKSRRQLTERMLKSERRNADLEVANRQLRERVRDLEAEIDRCNADLVRERRQFQKRLFMLADAKASSPHGLSVAEKGATALLSRSGGVKDEGKHDAAVVEFAPSSDSFVYGARVTAKDVDDREAFARSMENDAQDMKSALLEARRAKTMFAEEMGRLRRQQEKIRSERRQLRDLSATYATQLGVAMSPFVDDDDDDDACFTRDELDYASIRTRNLPLEMNVEDVVRKLRRIHQDETRSLRNDQHAQIDRLAEGVRALDALYARTSETGETNTLASAFAKLLPDALAAKVPHANDVVAETTIVKNSVEIQDLRATVAALRARMKKCGEASDVDHGNPADDERSSTPTSRRLGDMESRLQEMRQSLEAERALARERDAANESLRKKLRLLQFESRKKDRMLRGLEYVGKSAARLVEGL